jgi:phage gp46-like protein
LSGGTWITVASADGQQAVSGLEVDLLDLDGEGWPALAGAVLASLWCDARAPEEFAEGSSRGGWWADAYLGDTWGSLLWTLERSLLTDETCRQVEAYVLEALAWLLEDEVAKAVKATARREGTSEIVLEVTIERADGSTLALGWSEQWQRMVS